MFVQSPSCGRSIQAIFLFALACLAVSAGCNMGGNSVSTSGPSTRQFADGQRTPLTVDPLWLNDSQPGSYGGLSLAVSGTGKAAVLWMGFTGGGGLGNPLFVRLLDNTGWSDPVNVDDPYFSNERRNVSLAMDRSGNIIVTWIAYTGNSVMSDDGGWRVMANRYDAALAEWGGPVVIDDWGRNPSAAIDGEGNVVVAWRHSEDTLSSLNDVDEAATIRARRFDAAQEAWGDPMTLSAAGSDAPSIQAAGNGNLLVKWSGADGLHTRYFTRRTASWGTDRLFGAAYEFSNVVMDAAGNAWMAWDQWTPTEWSDPDNRGITHPTWFLAPVMVSRFDAATDAWGASSAVSAPDGIWGNTPRLCIASNGNIHMTWNQVEREYLDDVRYNQYAVRYDRRYDAAGGSWGAPPNRVGIGYSEQLAGDGDGNLLALSGVWIGDRIMRLIDDGGKRDGEQGERKNGHGAGPAGEGGGDCLDRPSSPLPGVRRRALRQRHRRVRGWTPADHHVRDHLVRGEPDACRVRRLLPSQPERGGERRGRHQGKRRWNAGLTFFTDSQLP
jgi:hypothetical protein